MLPLLKLIAERGGLFVKEAVEVLCDRFNLTAEERFECVPSGPRKIANNIWWARNHMKNAGLLHSPRRGYVEITEEGKQLLANQPEKLNRLFLCRYPSYVTSYTNIAGGKGSVCRSVDDDIMAIDPENRETPEESMERIYRSYKETMLDELLEKIHSCSSFFFERLVIELMMKLGYGGSQDDVKRALTEKSHDGVSVKYSQVERVI